MRIIISPAKKMVVDTDSFAIQALPCFLSEAERLKTALQALDTAALLRLWRCSEAIAAPHIARLPSMDLRHDLTPALLAYEGIQYRYMAPAVFEESALEYVTQHLRILSGFYGLLRPFDGVTPYRLEMQHRLMVDGCRDLYDFWGDKLAKALAQQTDTVLDLASWEYGRAVARHLPPGCRRVVCVFGQLQADRVIEKGTLCKMARGRMVRWMAENRVDRVEALRDFEELGYRFCKERSTQDAFVFIQHPAYRPGPPRRGADWFGEQP